AALAILRLGPPALLALADRWASYEANLFLGATLERALVLAAGEILPIRDASDQILLKLLDQGAAGLSILVYVFLHLPSVPETGDRHLRQLVTAGDAMVIERLLDLGGNAAGPRRRALIEVIGPLLASGKSRWLRRALHLLARFSAPDIGPAATAIKAAGLA